MSASFSKRLSRGMAVAFLLASLGIGLQPASAQKAPVDAARLQSARELMELTGSAKIFEAIMPAMTQQMTNVLTSQRPEKRAEIESVMKEMLVKFLARKQELIDQISLLYAERLTSEDLAGLITFYKSPAGQKFISIQPDLMKESMAAGQTWGRKIGAEIDAAARQELKKRGIDL